MVVGTNCGPMVHTMSTIQALWYLFAQVVTLCPSALAVS